MPALFPGTVKVPGPNSHFYTAFAPKSAAPFPFFPFNSPTHTPHVTSSQMVPFTPSDVATHSHILHPMPADSVDINMSSTANTKDDEGSNHSDKDMSADDDVDLAVPQLAQMGCDQYFRNGLRSRPRRCDDDPMGVARALNDAMAHNGATVVGGGTGDGEADDDSGVVPCVQRDVDASFTRLENLTQYGTDSSDSSEEPQSSSAFTSGVIGLVDNAEGNTITSDNEEESDAPGSMPQAIRRSSRTNKKSMVVPIVNRRTGRTKKSIVVVRDSVNKVSADVSANPLQSPWEQLEDDICICFLFSVVLLFIKTPSFRRCGCLN